jgi:hypothetical protein
MNSVDDSVVRLFNEVNTIAMLYVICILFIHSRELSWTLSKWKFMLPSIVLRIQINVLWNCRNFVSLGTELIDTSPISV